MSEVKLQRIYFTYCKEHKNYFNAGNGYNILAASDPNLTREILNEVKNVASEAISSGDPNNFVFTFTPETSYSQGVFCASFPASDIMGRGSQFQTVVYGLPKGALELRRCVEFYWNKRITDVRKRIDVWPDDAEKAVEENTASIDLDALIGELEQNEKEVEDKFWKRLTGIEPEDKRWQGVFSFLLEAYFRRKNAYSCIYLVAPAEDVALAVWGLARLLPESVISNVSFAVREQGLYRRRTIMGIDGELQKESVDGIARKIKNGSSDDVIYIAESEQGYGIERKTCYWLDFLTKVRPNENPEEYFNRIKQKDKVFLKYLNAREIKEIKPREPSVRAEHKEPEQSKINPILPMVGSLVIICLVVFGRMETLYPPDKEPINPPVPPSSCDPPRSSDGSIEKQDYSKVFELCEFALQNINDELKKIDDELSKDPKNNKIRESLAKVLNHTERALSQVKLAKNNKPLEADVAPVEQEKKDSNSSDETSSNDVK